MSDQEQRTAHALEQSEAGLVTASETLTKAHLALREAELRDRRASAQLEAAREYHAEAQSNLSLAVGHNEQAARRLRRAIACLLVALVAMIVVLVL